MFEVYFEKVTSRKDLEGQLWKVDENGKVSLCLNGKSASKDVWMEEAKKILGSLPLPSIPEWYRLNKENFFKDMEGTLNRAAELYDIEDLREASRAGHPKYLEEYLMSMPDRENDSDFDENDDCNLDWGF